MFTRFAPFAFIAACGITFLQTAAFAAPAPGAVTYRTVQVAVSDLNLANPADITRLDARIVRAAKFACEPADWRNLQAVSARSSCVSAAVAAAAPRKDQLVATAQSAQLASRSTATGLSAD